MWRNPISKNVCNNSNGRLRVDDVVMLQSVFCSLSLIMSSFQHQIQKKIQTVKTRQPYKRIFTRTQTEEIVSEIALLQTDP